jgi:hypothetical protein
MVRPGAAIDDMIFEEKEKKSERKLKAIK